MNITFDDKQIRQALARFPEYTRSAISGAVTKLTYDIRDALLIEVSSKVDRPVPFTSGPVAWYFDNRSRGSQISQRVGLKKKQAAYLQYLVKGQSRDKKVIEGGGRGHRAVPKFRGLLFTPSRFIQLDQYGNVPRDQYTKIFKAAAESRSRTDYFFLPQKRGPLYPGIYKRVKEGGKERPVPMFFANQSAKNFGARIDVYGVAQKAYDDRFQFQVDRAIRTAFKALGVSQ